MVLNPSTPVGCAQDQGDVDFVLVMSVNPGFGSQSFHHVWRTAVRALRSLRQHRCGDWIDSGIDAHNALGRRGRTVMATDLGDSRTQVHRQTGAGRIASSPPPASIVRFWARSIPRTISCGSGRTHGLLRHSDGRIHGR